MTVDDVKRLLQLTELEMEGGFFCETYRSRWSLSHEALPDNYTGSRSLETAIYYLITPDSFSRLHRVPGAEIFHFYLGDPVVMLQLLPAGNWQTVMLGTDLLAGHRPQVVVRGGIWQGCRLAPGGSFALLGTTMSPGFDYADYEACDAETLIARYPEAVSLIREYTIQA